MVARRGRRHKGKRLEPPLPQAQDELILPKYFRMIRSGGADKASEKRREVMPGMMPGTQDVPKAVMGSRSRQFEPLPFPNPAPAPERVPLIIRAARRVISALKVEPDRPVSMPVVPVMNYPPLYTRYPIMKTVTKKTDAAGEIAVTYSHTFETVPGVVITVKDPDNVFGTVFATILTGFEVRMFKMDHDHGGTVDTDGAHTPTINADGNHQHEIQGTGSLSLSTNYGRLVLANNTDYEKLHTHENITSAGGSEHRHVNNPTDYESAHTHTNPSTGGISQSHTHTIPATDGPDDVATALIDVGWDEWCEACSYWLIGSFSEASFAQSSHYHPNTNKNTGNQSRGHTHTQGSTGAGSSHRHDVGDTQLESAHTHHIYPTGTGTYANPLGHRHLISSDALYDHYVYNVELTLDLWTSAYENPYHAHSGGNIVGHGHAVPSDGRVLLKDTNVTITYIAQEESS